MWPEDEYTIADDRHADRLFVTRNDGTARLVFPYRWDGRRIFLFTHKRRPQPQIEYWQDGSWVGMKMDQVTFFSWMTRLEPTCDHIGHTLIWCLSGNTSALC